MSDAFDFSTFTNEPLDLGEWDNWQEQEEFPPALPEGTYRGKVDKIRSTEKRADGYLVAVADFRVVGGPRDNRTVTWQRLSNKPRDGGNRASILTDLFKSAGLNGPSPVGNLDCLNALKRVYEASIPVMFAVRWRGFCTICRDTKLVELVAAGLAPTPLTGGIQAAKDTASKDQWNEANNFATKARSSRSFPDGKDVMPCPTCGNEVRAQVQVSRFLAKR